MPSLLAIECSANVNAVAYLPDIENPRATFDEISLDGAKAASWLLPAIDRVLTQASASKTDVNIVAFGAGPGSFTGVRSACATAQALAYSWQATLISVDCLEALAEASGMAQVDVLLDARMNELYTASFGRNAQGKLTRLSETLLISTANFSAQNGATLLGSGAALVSPPGSLAARPSAEATQLAEDRWAQGVARVAAAKYARREFTDPQCAEPIYVRNNVAQTEAQRALRTGALSPLSPLSPT